MTTAKGRVKKARGRTNELRMQARNKITQAYNIPSNRPFSVGSDPLPAHAQRSLAFATAPNRDKLRYQSEESADGKGQNIARI